MSNSRDSHVNLSPEAKRELLAKLLREKANKQDTCVPQLFEQQVARTPDAIACYFDNITLTYAELNSKANQLAHYLRSLGVQPEQRVGLYLERSPDFLIALIALFKAGGVYVSLDPAYPLSYVERILKDARFSVVITSEQLKNQLTEHAIPVNCHLLCVDNQDYLHTLDTYPQTNPSAVLRPENMSQLAYTSGSTGEPKGVMVPHRQILNWLYALWGRMPFGSDDVVAQKTNAAFTVSLKEMLAGLLAGVPQVIITDAAVKDPKRFVDALRHWRVTRLNIVPSHLQALLENVDDCAAALSSLKHCITAGEPLSQTLRAKVNAALPGVRLWNNYGCTELNDALYCNPDEQDSTGTFVPMGRPLANTRTYVVNETLRRVPLGVTGELCVDSVGLSRGYWNSPALTAERYVPNPYSEQPGGRLFRTGDVVRQLEDGRLEYVNRNDFQIKIRGQRIEIAQIENILDSHPDIDKAVVMGYAKEETSPHLVAYYTGNTVLPVAQLKAFLGKELPDYMVPTFYVHLDTLPTLPNGKLNRLALPAPTANTASIAAELLPQSDDERQLAQLWREVLKIEQISMEDNFFNSGGHSLTAIKLISRIRAVFDVDLSMQTLFENQTLAKQIAYIREKQTALPEIALPAIVKMNRDNQTLALSPYQERFWLIDQIQPGNMRYTRLLYDYVPATLDPQIFIAAINEVIRRHAILRTIFPSVGGQPAQTILASYTLDVPVIDLLPIPAEQRTTHLRDFMQNMAQTPFNLATTPVVRAAVVRISEEQSLISIMLHHIAYDVWSMGLLQHEVRTLCRAFEAGEPSPLPELPAQYADFSEWQNHTLQGEPMNKLVEYAASQLRDAPPVLEWPAPMVHARPERQTNHGATLHLRLPKALTQTLYQFSSDNNSTLFITLFAGFNALLYRYSGQHDFCVGTLSANRNRIEIESLIGNFVNILALRFRFQETDSYRQLLEHTRRQVFAAQSHQDLPFERLIEQPFVHRNPSYSPLFQIMFTMENENLGNQGDQNNAGNKIASLDHLTDRASREEDEIHSTYARFDLTVTAEEDDHQINLAFEYNTDLFDEAVINRLMESYLALLTDAATNPDTRIIDLAIIPQTDYQRLMVQWNNTAKQNTAPYTLHQIFEQQAAATPDQLAVQYQQETLTYAQLNARANQLAHYLRAGGIKADDLVALYLEPSLSMLVGILGILKAGAAYVPLDPAYPAERLAWMVEDADPVIILTQQSLRAALPASSVRNLCLDSGWSAVAGQPAHNPDTQTLPANGAYVIYTSGSTGRPKGTLVSHDASVNFIRALVHRLYPDMPGREVLRVGLNASYAFDGSMKQLLLLLYGCPIVLIPSAVRYDPQLMRAFISEYQLDVFNCTPSQLRTLLTDEQGLPCRYVLIGGEAIDAELWQKMMRFPAQHFYNVYGPTECAAVTTACRIGEQASPVIGKPLDNVQTYILDKQWQPTPIGIPGEIYIGGMGLARGYLERPDLTAERFIPNPFCTIPGARLYRTGDQARFVNDGNIEYLGRLDRQIKIRGYRVEIGEIESALTRNPQIGEAIVVMREDQQDDRYLVAYVTAATSGQASEATLDVNQLRTELREFLPDYMVPARIIIIERIPLTVNGKIDYAALDQADRQDEENNVAAPRTPTEETLLGIWKDTLKIDQVDIHHNFFDIGGHSFRALVLLAGIKRTFGTTLSISTIFSHPSIAQQAELIENSIESSKPAEASLVVPLHTRPNAPILFCIHTVGGQVSYYRELASLLGDKLSVYGIQSAEAAGLPEQDLSISELAIRYTAAIKSAQPQGPYRLLGWSAGSLIALAVAAQLEKQGDTVSYLAMLDSKLTARTQEDIEKRTILSAFYAFSGGRISESDMDMFAQRLGEYGIDKLNDDKIWQDNTQLLLGYFQKWADMPATADTISLIRQQVVLIYRHFKTLLPNFVFPQVKVAPHICWAGRSENIQLANGFDWSGLSANPDGIVADIIDATHFDMLQSPQVAALAKAILSRQEHS